MIDYEPLYQFLRELELTAWAEELSAEVARALDVGLHGDMRAWLQTLEALPVSSPASVNIVDGVQIGEAGELAPEQRVQLRDTLMALHPWRKGPYRLYGVDVDTEWRSDWKWDRLAPHIAPLENRLVLDVGCGNGYHCWRMLGVGARMVVGIDPTLLSVVQFWAIRELYGRVAPVYVLPLGIEQMPANLALFDTVFSMGVLYHRRSPFDHLMELKGCLRPGGELVLETLVVDGDANTVLVPEGRYAQMRNVWFLPSCEALMQWMRRCGFKNVRLCDVTETTSLEQRSTEWMRFNSLADFLDPENPRLTREGLPAPVRVIVIANVE